jgi:hypothetical protein
MKKEEGVYTWQTLLVILVIVLALGLLSAWAALHISK